MKVKPGFKTTEFWLSLLAMLLGAVIASGVLDTVTEDTWIVRIIGGAVTALAAMGYVASRATVKTKSPDERNDRP